MTHEAGKVRPRSQPRVPPWRIADHLEWKKRKVGSAQNNIEDGGRKAPQIPNAVLRSELQKLFDIKYSSCV